MTSKSDINLNQEFRRKRDFWSLEGKNMLYKLVQPKINVIDDKGNSAVMVRRKLEVWEEIRKRMDSLGYSYEVKQLKAQYFRYKLAQKEMRLNKQNMEDEDLTPPLSNSNELEYLSMSNSSNVKPEFDSEIDVDVDYVRLNGSSDSNTDRIIQIAEIIDENIDEHEMEIPSSPIRKRGLPIPPRYRKSFISGKNRLNILIQRKRLKQVNNEILMATELHEHNLKLKQVQLEIEKQNLELIKLRVENEKKKGRMCSCVRQYVTNCDN